MKANDEAADGRIPVILLVDDEPRLLEGLKRNLLSEPFHVETAPGPEAALKILERMTVDVVISDEQMPGMSGSEFLARVARTWPETVRIILTGQASLEAAVRAINEGGIYRFLTKPCHAAELVVTIQQALQFKELTRESARLLATARDQQKLISDLETRHPGITDVERGEDGGITLDDSEMSFDELIRQMREQSEGGGREGGAAAA